MGVLLLFWSPHSVLCFKGTETKIFAPCQQPVHAITTIIQLIQEESVNLLMSLSYPMMDQADSILDAFQGVVYSVLSHDALRWPYLIMYCEGVVSLFRTWNVQCPDPPSPPPPDRTDIAVQLPVKCIMVNPEQVEIAVWWTAWYGTVCILLEFFFYFHNLQSLWHLHWYAKKLITKNAEVVHYRHLKRENPFIPTFWTKIS